jgi:hypothetical protein
MKRNLNFNEWIQKAKEMKNKVMCEINSLTTSKVGLLIFQLSITEVSSALDHSNM